MKGGFRPRLKRGLKFSEERSRNRSCRELLRRVFISEVTDVIRCTGLFEVYSRSLLNEGNCAFCYSVAVVRVRGASGMFDAIVYAPVL